MRAKLFKDRVTPNTWRVEREDEDGAIEVRSSRAPMPFGERFTTPIGNTATRASLAGAVIVLCLNCYPASVAKLSPHR
jgi:hypothetical protein